jgi:hypothetical protein
MWRRRLRVGVGAGSIQTILLIFVFAVILSFNWWLCRILSVFLSISTYLYSQWTGWWVDKRRSSLLVDLHWTLPKNATKPQLYSALHHNNEYMHRCQAPYRRMTEETSRRPTYNRAYFKYWAWSRYIWSVVARRCGSLKRMIELVMPRVALDATISSQSSNYFVQCVLEPLLGLLKWSATSKISQSVLQLHRLDYWSNRTHMQDAIIGAVHRYLHATMKGNETSTM